MHQITFLVSPLWFNNSNVLRFIAIPFIVTTFQESPKFIDTPLMEYDDKAVSIKSLFSIMKSAIWQHTSRITDCWNGVRLSNPIPTIRLNVSVSICWLAVFKMRWGSLECEFQDIRSCRTFHQHISWLLTRFFCCFFGGFISFVVSFAVSFFA